MSVTFSAYSPATQQFVADELAVNMANANAAHVLDVLGFGEDVRAGDLCGTVSGEDFLGRVLMALAVSPADAGIPAHEDHTAGGMLWIEGGRPEGYTQERLGQLRELAEDARDRGCSITWG